MKTKTMFFPLRMARLALAAVMALSCTLAAQATEFITDVMVIGARTEGQINLLKVTYESNIDNVMKTKSEKMRTALKLCGMQAESYAKDLSLYDTGLLRNSITFALDGETPDKMQYRADHGSEHGSYRGTAPKEDVDCVYIGTNVEYAPYIELGHHTASGSMVSPHPFLRPAIQNHIQEYRSIVESVLKS